MNDELFCVGEQRCGERDEIRKRVQNKKGKGGKGLLSVKNSF